MRILVSLLLLLVTLPLSAGLNLLQNGGFEQGLNGWAASGNFDILGVGASEGTFVLRFNSGQKPANAILSQTVSTTPGQNYRLSFDYGVLAVSPLSSQVLDVAIYEGMTQETQGGVKRYIGQGTMSLGYARKEFSFTAPGPSIKVEFRDVSQVTDSIDSYLDNIRLEAETTSGPPPLPPPLDPTGVEDPTGKTVTMSWLSTNFLSQEVKGFIIRHTEGLGSVLTNYLRLDSGYNTNLSAPPLFSILTDTNSIHPEWRDHIGLTPTRFFAVLPNPITLGAHRWAVMATNEYLESPLSAEVLMPAKLASPPVAISMVSTLTQMGTNSSSDFKVIWQPGETAVQDGVTSFRIYHMGEGSPEYTNITAVLSRLSGTNMPNVFSADLHGLPPGLHKFQIKSQNMWGESVASRPLISPPGSELKLTTTIVITVQ